MLIATKLKIVVLVPVVIALVASLAITYQKSFLQADWENRNRLRAVVIKISNFNSLTFSYMRYKEERPIQQFLAEHEKISQLINTIELTDPIQRHKLKALENRVNLLADIFNKLVLLERRQVDNFDSAALDAEERLGGQIISISRRAVEDGLTLLASVTAKTSSTHALLNQFLFMLIVGVAVALILIVIGIKRSISLSLKKITEGMEIIGSGRLDHKIGMTELDEIGGLARSFDQMSARLAQSYVDLQRSEERLRLIIETANIGTFDFYPQTGQLIWSDVVRLQFGLPSEAPVDYNVFLAGIHPDDRERINEIFENSLRSKSEHMHDVEYRTTGGPDGKERWIYARYHILFNENGEPVRSVGASLDITERKKIHELQAVKDTLEETVQQRTRELIETQKQYLHAEKLAAIGKLSASIAHEINNPLQAIMTILKGLRTAVDGNDQKMLNLATEECDRIKKLIRDLQNFYRPSTQKKEFTDLHTILDSLLLLLKSDFKRKKISVELDYQKRLPQTFVVPDQIKQVFLNLLANAAEACGDCGGVITVSTRQAGEEVAVTIKDNGIGIKPEDMDQIFRPFYTSKAAVKGTGLGLSISYGIVKSHGGKITVESQPGQGASFTILLPVKQESEVETKVW